MNFNVDGVVRDYIDKITNKIIEEESLKAQQVVRERIEKEALNISLKLAQMLRIQDGAECITISVVKK